MRPMLVRLLLLISLFIVTLPSRGAAQERRTGLSSEQWRHWAVKVGASTATFEGLNRLDVPPDVSAVVATVAPTVIGKFLYLDDGLGPDPEKRWPDAGFVARDVVGELCVQSAPIWFRFVTSRDDHRVLRGILAVSGYGMAIMACARTFEVR